MEFLHDPDFMPEHILGLYTNSPMLHHCSCSFHIFCVNYHFVCCRLSCCLFFALILLYVCEKGSQLSNSFPVSVPLQVFIILGSIINLAICCWFLGVYLFHFHDSNQQKTSADWDYWKMYCILEELCTKPIWAYVEWIFLQYNWLTLLSCRWKQC